MITVQDTIASLKSASAIQGEKITVALNTGERAEKASKNVMKKLAVVTELQGKVNTVQQVQVITLSNNFKKFQISYLNYNLTKKESYGLI